MTRLFVQLARRVLPEVLARSCGGSTIPRSGAEGERVNCFIVKIDADSSGRGGIAVTAIDGLALQCLEWDPTAQVLKPIDPILLSDIKNRSITIRHYYGLSEVLYTGIYDYVLGRCGWPYLRIWITRGVNRFAQARFNRRKLVLRERTELLRFLVENYSDGSTINSVSLMTQLFSLRWVMHPSSDAQHQKLQLYLDSLVRAGELKRVDHGYALTGQALTTLERYEREQRRHSEMLGVQRRI